MRERSGKPGGKRGNKPQEKSGGRAAVAAGVGLMALALFLAISLLTYSQQDYNPDGRGRREVDNLAGLAGAYLADRLFIIFGFGWLPFPVILFLSGWNCFRQSRFRSVTFKAFLPLLLILLYCSAVYLPQFGDRDIPFRLGGLVGEVLSSRFFIPNFGRVGGLVVIAACGLLVVISSTDWNIGAAARWIAERVSAARLWLVGRLSELFDGAREDEEDDWEDEQEEAQVQKARRPKTARVEDEEEESSPAVRVKRESVVAPSMIELHRPRIVDNGSTPAPVSTAKKALRAPVPENGRTGGPAEDIDSGDAEGGGPVALDIPGGAGEEVEEILYRYPPMSLLDDPPGREERQSAHELQENARRLEKALADFGIEARVVQVTPGPVITRYEVEPAPGTKVSRIVTLSDDLALVMKARRIRIQAPIPGKAAVGIELPNPKPSVVYLKEIVESEEFQRSSSKLLLALGRTTSGDPFCADLAKMPHLLIAGATGSGKSVCINALISSLLFRASPEEVRMIMIDPKRVELAIYGDIPHLLAPVLVEAKVAAETLKWAVEEMEARYQRFAEVGVRNITDYNRRSDVQRMTFVVILVDELADLMMVGTRDVEDYITRLAQMARSVGIHLILATQRPSVNVITGLIKANFPARIAFQVASKIDSRIVLDINGAENLLGSGDMLYLPPGESEPLRIHGAYISTQETESLVEFIRGQRISAQRVDVSAPEEGGTPRFEGRDELFEEAARTVVRYQQGSASLLQRRLKVGYARAARLIDELEAAGVVGASEGSRSRDVLVDEGSLDDMFGPDLDRALGRT